MRFVKVLTCVFVGVILSSCVSERELRQQQICTENTGKKALVLSFPNDTYGADSRVENILHKEMCYQIINKYNLAQELRQQGSSLNVFNVNRSDYETIKRLSGADILVFGNAYTTVVEYKPTNQVQKSTGNYAVDGARQGAELAMQARAGTYLVVDTFIMDSNNTVHNWLQGEKIQKLN